MATSSWIPIIALFNHCIMNINCYERARWMQLHKIGIVSCSHSHDKILINILIKLSIHTTHVTHTTCLLVNFIGRTSYPLYVLKRTHCTITESSCVKKANKRRACPIPLKFQQSITLRQNWSNKQTLTPTSWILLPFQASQIINTQHESFASQYWLQFDVFHNQACI